MLIEQIKQDRIQAMKDKDTIKKDILSTLIGESSKEEKIPTDEKVIATIKKFIKNAHELQVHIANNHGNQSYIKAQFEINILTDYLPNQLDEQEIRDIITVRKDNGDSNLGVIMKFFKTHYDGQYDGSLVNKLAKDLL